MKQGFVLIYTVLIMSFILVITGVTFSAVEIDIRKSRESLESVKAYYAADTGIECARYFQRNYQVFDPKKAPATYSCGVGSFTAGRSASGCINYTYPQFTLNFSNGSCTIVQVQSIQRTIIEGGVLKQVCDYLVVSNGRSTCGPTNRKVTERTRWENL